MWKPEKQYTQNLYLQSRRDTDVENKTYRHQGGKKGGKLGDWD